MMQEDAGCIAADPEERCMSEAHHAAVAERQIEADAGERQNSDARAERHVEVFTAG